MEQEVRTFLNDLANNKINKIYVARNMAQQLLSNEFTKEVLNVFEWQIRGHKETIKAVKEQDKVGFVKSIYYWDEVKEFVNAHFDKLDEILTILKCKIEAREQETKEEVSENE